MDTSASRFISVTLSESEWRALRAIEPNPTAWVKQQISRRLADAGVESIVGDGESMARPADIRLRTI